MSRVSTLATHLLACSEWGIHAYPHCHAMQPRHQSITGRPATRCRSSKRTLVVRRGFGDDLLDYIQAGPKLRKWYGEGERMPRDGGNLGDDLEPGGPLEERAVVPRTAVLVTNADSPTAEQVVLQLILARREVKILVKNVATAITAYGSYVTPCSGTTGNGQALQSALRGARAVICTGRLGDLSNAAEQGSLEHLILVASAGGSSAGFSLDSFTDAEAAAQRDRGREEAVSRCSVPHTIVRVGRVRDTPGGQQGLALSQDGSGALGDISREDLARVLVECLQHSPKKALVFSVENRQDDAPEDLASQISRLRETVPV